MSSVLILILTSLVGSHLPPRAYNPPKPPTKKGATKKALPAQKSKDPDAEYRLRVERWEKDAKLLRQKKPLAKVDKGTAFVVADVLWTISKSIDVYAGCVSVQVIKDHSKLRYSMFKPINLNPVRDVEVQTEIENGELYNRVSLLSKGSNVRSKALGLSAASKGTAYSVQVIAGVIEVLVAEGKVNMEDPRAPGRVLTLGPRQFIRTSNALPAAPQPATRDQEAKIRALLSLPIRTLKGYSDPRDLHRSDADSIVTLNVRPALLVLDEGDPRAAGRLNTVVRDKDGFAFATPKGATVKFPGATFIAGAKNGRLLVAQEAKEGFFLIDANGARVGRLGEGYEKASVAPNGDVGIGLVRATEEKSGAAFVLFTKSGVVARVAAPILPQEWSALWPQNGRRPLVKGKNSDGTWFVLSLASARQATNGGPSGPYVYRGAEEPSFSPLRDWIITKGASGGSYVLTDAQDGTQLKIESQIPIEFVPPERGGERIAYMPPRKTRVVADPYDLVRAVPYTGGTIVGTKEYGASSLSPNGELVTFAGGSVPTIQVADSANFARRSDAYVGLVIERNHGWVSGNEVWYDDEIEGKPDSIIVTLGVKRIGALPVGTKGYRAGAENSIQLYEFPGFSLGDEYNGSSITSNGRIAGVAKGAGMSGYVSPASGSPLDEMLQGIDGVAGFLPFDMGEDGTIVGNGKDGMMAWDPKRGAVAYPETTSDFDMDPTVLNDGRIWIAGKLWQPWKGERKTENGVTESGTVTNPAPADVKILSISRNGHWAGVKDDEQNRKVLVVGELGKEYRTVPSVVFRWVSFNERPSDGDLPEGGVGDGNLLINDKGIVAWFRDRQGSTTLERYEPGRRVTSYPIPKGAFPFMRGIGPEGEVYGEVSSPNGAPNYGFVMEGSELLNLNKLLPSGWSCHVVRKMNSKHQMVGAFFRDGQAVIAVVDLEALRGRR